MSHFFNTSNYIQFSLQNHTNLKKTLESRVEKAAETVSDDLHPNTYQEDIIIDTSTFAFLY